MNNQETGQATLPLLKAKRPVPEVRKRVIRVTDPAFFAGFQQATLDFELTYKPTMRDTSIILDDTDARMMLMATAAANQSDMWKAGYLAGFFAALYGIPCCRSRHSVAIVQHYSRRGIREAL